MGSRLEKRSGEVRKRLESHTFDDEDGEEYDASEFGGFGDYFRRKKIKLQNLDVELRAKSADNPQIFRGVVAHVNGYTQPSLGDLHKMIVSHGGGFLQYLDGKTMVTHIIASTLTPKKVVEFKKYRIVKPAWVVESVKAGRLLPWNSFRVVEEGAAQKILGFDNGRVISQRSKPISGYREQTDTSWYTKQRQSASLMSESELLNSSNPQDDTDVASSEHIELGEQSFAHSKEHADNNADKLRQIIDNNAASPKQTDFIGDENIDSDQGLLTAGFRTESLRHQVNQSVEKEKVAPKTPSKGKSPKRHDEMTAEEHNAILLADPKIRKSTVVDPGFIQQYYRESRLHHLSTWKADLKSELQAMAPDVEQGCKRRTPGARRYILHVDFDSFFAAVSLKKRPELIDKPVAIAHGAGNSSELASCNYPARAFGLKNGMWMKRALELCPNLHILPYDFQGYEKASKAFYTSIIATGGLVQSVSIDEALVDVSGLCIIAGGGDGINRAEGSIEREQEKADQIAQQLRDDVKQKTGCNVSVGIGGNILLAKLALKKAKPAGQYQVRPEDILEFLSEFKVEDLPGVAYSIGGKLEEIGVKYVRDVREFSKEKLVTTLGPKTGEKIWEYARGIDKKEVGDVEIRKSVSAEVNWGVRFENQEQVDEFIRNLCTELNRRLHKEKLKGKQLSLKIMKRAADAPRDPPKHLGHGRCDTFNRSVALGVATTSIDTLTKESLSMLKSLGFTPGELRGIGLQMTKLEKIKSDHDGSQDSSQRKLQFKFDTTPKKANIAMNDPIEDVTTPKKHKDLPGKISFGADHLNTDSPSRKPLNTAGTQFLIPSQIDPNVLNELPLSIQQSLRRQLAQSGAKPKDTKENGSGHRPIGRTSNAAALPSKSQIDPEILKALPDDVRAEVSEFFNITQSGIQKEKRSEDVNRATRQLSVPPVERGVPSKRGISAPQRKRGRPTKLMTREAGLATLTQKHFISKRSVPEDQEAASTLDGEKAKAEEAEGPKQPETIDIDFLKALPPDLRHEVLKEHQKSLLQAPSSRLVGISKGGAYSGPANKIILPSRPSRPTFTSRKLCSLPQLRNAISNWVKEFEADGPYSEDVTALAKYLSKVIVEERDMNKAASCFKWFVWVVDEQASGTGKITKWKGAVDEVKAALQSSVKERELGQIPL